MVKYGYSNFRLEIIEYCAPEDVVAREQYYIDLIKPEYNILSSAGSSLGYKHTTESLAKMSGQNHVMFGKKHSELSKEKIRQALLGENSPNFGKSLPEEHKAKISASQLNSCKVSVLDLETNTETIFDSFGIAARTLNCPVSSLTSNLKGGKKPYKKRYVIKRLGLLNAPSNDEVHPKGKGTESLEVLDDKGLLRNSFTSVNECALFYGVSIRTINRRLAKNVYFTFNGKNLKIKRINSDL